MNFAKLFESIESAVKQSPDAKAGWNTLVEVADRNSGRKRATALDAVDIDGDVAAVRRELRRIVRNTPIPTAVDTLYFGLFDLSVEGSNADEIGFYVAGVDGFDPEDPDSLVDPVYFPDDC